MGKSTVKTIVHLDQAELVCRMVEAMFDRERPTGMTARQALDHMEPEQRELWLRMANEVVEYFEEQIATSEKVH